MCPVKGHVRSLGAGTTQFIHTHYLEATVRVDFPHVTRAEPPLASLIHKEVLIAVLMPVVTHGDVGPTNQHLPPRVWRVLFGVATCSKNHS